MEKMTYIVALNSAIACEALSAEVREKLTALRDAQAKKSNAPHKLTPTQIENEAFKADILDAMIEGSTYTVGELMKVVPSLTEKGISNQRTSAIVRQLVESGKVVRSVVKNVAYFSKVEE